MPAGHRSANDPLAAVAMFGIGPSRCYSNIIPLPAKPGIKAMAEPLFNCEQQVYIARNHCALCWDIAGRLTPPVVVKAAMPYCEGYAYRLQDSHGASYNTREPCLCTNPEGHVSNPCKHCHQAIAA